MADRHAYLHPRDLVMRTMERIYSYRMTTTSGGNVSLRDDDGGIWITPARVDKGSLTRADIVCVRPDGSCDGPHRPSSEFPFHRAIYAARPDLRAVVHAHPVALVAFSIVGRVPDTRLFHRAREVCGEAGFAPYALPGSAALGEAIAAAFARGHDCVVLQNHGIVVGGANLDEAFQRFETLEFTAKTIVKAAHLGEVRYLALDDLQLSRQGVAPPPEAPPEPPSSREKELRRALREFLRRGYRQRLLISTEGSFSARVNGGAFLITPTQADRYELELEDFVLIREGQRRGTRLPSRAARLHEAIYSRHPRVGAIVNAYPVNATAFSVTQAELPTRTIPESFLLLRDVARIPFGRQFREPEQVAEAVSMERPIALLENDGVLVCGTDALDAYDRLEVLESTAEALINGRLVGELSPMPDEAINGLMRAFFPETA